MRRLAIAVALLASCAASAQDAPPLVAAPPSVASGTVRLELNPRDQMILLSMCETARWAARMQFDESCDTLRAKFKAGKPTADESAPSK